MSDALVSTMTRPMLRAAEACPTLAASANRDTLSPGTRPNELEIVRFLGAAGFAVVCLALDAVLLRHVATKAYMAGALARLAKRAMASMLSPAHADGFALGLKSLVSTKRVCWLASTRQPWSWCTASARPRPRARLSW